MNRIQEIRKTLKEIFEQGYEVGYTEEDIQKCVELLDFAALSQVFQHNTVNIFAYTAFGTKSDDYNYCGSPLLSERGVKLFSDPIGYVDTVGYKAQRSVELWLLEDDTLAVITCFRVMPTDSGFVTEYRAYKGDDWTEVDPNLELSEIIAALIKMCYAVYEHTQPAYEQ